MGRRGAKPTDDPDRCDNKKQGREDALGSLCVEHSKRKMVNSAFRQDDARNQKPGNDEKYVHAGKSARNQRAIGMKSDHTEHREGAQSIDVFAEVERAAAPGGGEVGRVERLVQLGFRELVCEGVTGKAREAYPQAALADPVRQRIMAAMPRSSARRGQVALFRARDEAALSAARLRRLGYGAACLPVVTVASLPFTPKRPRYEAVIATSAKAFSAIGPVDRTAPLFVVGARTARAAEAEGWRLAAPPAPDVATLVETLNHAVPSGAHILYLAGRDRKTALEETLSPALALEAVDVYAAEARERWKPAEVRALAGSTIALHYSRRSAALAADLAERAGAGTVFRKLTHVCLSQDVAKPLEAIGAVSVRVAASPNEPALFAVLVEAEPLFPSHRASRI